MKILAIDTATEYLSIAVSDGSQIFQQQLKVANRQSEFLLPEITKLLKNAGLVLQQIEAIAYNQGPGSFTGLRIGLSCALGLAYSLNCPLLPIPAFAMYAPQATVTKTQLIVALDARLGQVYLAGINLLDYSYSLQPQVVDPEQVAALIQVNPAISPENCQLCGSGFQAYPAKFAAILAQGFELIQTHYPPAAVMIGLVQQKIFPAVNVAAADLIYLRNKVALDINEQLQSRNSC